VPPLLRALANGFDKNLCYVFGCSETRQAALIDAGIRLEAVEAALGELGLEPVALVVTHSHGDHLSEAPDVLRHWPLTVHAFDPGVRSRLGNPAFRLLQDGDEIVVGGERLEALHTPGHSPDSACFRSGGLLFTGDTLFVGRTGRTVGATSSIADLYRSILRLKQLAPQTTLLPGHDYGPTPSSTLARELAQNPFLQADSEEAFVRVMEGYEKRRRRG
jgi:hydroxyacylglutathione hydrolase